MATPGKPPQDPTAAPVAPPKKKRGKLLLILGVLAVVLSGAGGAGWYFMRPADPNAPHAAEKPKPSIFVPLESFTVNLLPSDGQPQFIQAGLTLKLDDPEAVELIKSRMPQVRDRLLMVLSSKRGPDLLATEGKQKLAVEISEAVKKVIAPAKTPVAPPASPAATEASPVSPAQVADAPTAAAAQAADAPTAPTVAADKRTDAKTVGAKPARHGPEIEVLFTSFIIQ